MKVEKQQSQQEKKVQKVSKPDWKNYQVDWDKELGFGKYAFRTMRWLQSNDESYLDWMLLNNIPWERGLIEPIQVVKKKYSHFITESGECWIGIREVEGQSFPVPDEWIK